MGSRSVSRLCLPHSLSMRLEASVLRVIVLVCFSLDAFPLCECATVYSSSLLLTGVWVVSGRNYCKWCWTSAFWYMSFGVCIYPFLLGGATLLGMAAFSFSRYYDSFPRCFYQMILPAAACKSPGQFHVFAGPRFFNVSHSGECVTL